MFTSKKLEVDDALDCYERYEALDWTDGLPVIPPTEASVRAFLEHAGLASGYVIGVYGDRATAITAEKVAINAVMAGCRAEYMPVVVAAVEALTDPAFHLNHIASMSSPWPLLIISGPVVNELSMAGGEYAFGSTRRSNATIGRAVSLLLANCFGARVGGVQQGSMGNPVRYSFLLAENVDTPWEPLRIELGFRHDESVVTLFPALTGPVTAVTPYYGTSGPAIAEPLGETIASGYFTPGTYVVHLTTSFVEKVAKAGWGKRDLKDYLLEHTRSSVADLRKRGRWDRDGMLTGKLPPPAPEDADRWVHLFKREPWYEHMWDDSQKDIRRDIYIVVAGGNAGAFASVVPPYLLAANPVTRAIKKAGAKR